MKGVESPDREARSTPSRIVEPSWRTIRMVLHEGTGEQVDITLLRPSSFVELHRIEVGAEFAMELADIGSGGMARVTAIEPCPAIKGGDEQTTRVVTPTFKHHAGQPWGLRIEGHAEPIGYNNL